jgi:hypothetical protein
MSIPIIIELQPRCRAPPEGKERSDCRKTFSMRTFTGNPFYREAKKASSCRLFRRFGLFSAGCFEVLHPHHSLRPDIHTRDSKFSAFGGQAAFDAAIPGVRFGSRHSNPLQALAGPLKALPKSKAGKNFSQNPSLKIQT